MKSHQHLFFLFFMLTVCTLLFTTTICSAQGLIKKDHKIKPFELVKVKEFAVSYGEIQFNWSGDLIWWGCPDITYIIVGLGQYDIHWELNYTIYTYDEQHMPQPQTGVFQGNDSLYLFDFHQTPIIKIWTSYAEYFPFLFFKEGSWTGRLYIDGVPFATQSFAYTRPP